MTSLNLTGFTWLDEECLSLAFALHHVLHGQRQCLHPGPRRKDGALTPLQLHSWLLLGVRPFALRMFQDSCSMISFWGCDFDPLAEVAPQKRETAILMPLWQVMMA